VKVKNLKSEKLRIKIKIKFIPHDMLHIPIRYLLYFRYTNPQFVFSSNSGGSNKLPEDGRLLPKHVGANT
jgi:predicted metallopeptidase